jgi:hypothetical protein
MKSFYTVYSDTKVWWFGGFVSFLLEKGEPSSQHPEA